MGPGTRPGAPERSHQDSPSPGGPSRRLPGLAPFVVAGAWAEALAAASLMELAVASSTPALRTLVAAGILTVTAATSLARTSARMPDWLGPRAPVRASPASDLCHSFRTLPSTPPMMPTWRDQVPRWELPERSSLDGRGGAARAASDPSRRCARSTRAIATPCSSRATTMACSRSSFRLTCSRRSRHASGRQQPTRSLCISYPTADVRWRRGHVESWCRRSVSTAPMR